MMPSSGFSSSTLARVPRRIWREVAIRAGFMTFSLRTSRKAGRVAAAISFVWGFSTTPAPTIAHACCSAIACTCASEKSQARALLFPVVEPQTARPGYTCHGRVANRSTFCVRDGRPACTMRLDASAVNPWMLVVEVVTTERQTSDVTMAALETGLQQCVGLETIVGGSQTQKGDSKIS